MSKFEEVNDDPLTGPMGAGGVKGFSEVLKANPYHDETGRFSTRDSARFVSTGPKFQKSMEKLKAELAATKASMGEVSYYEDQSEKALVDHDARSLKSTEKQWASLTTDEKKAVYEYTSEGVTFGYERLNQALGKARGDLTKVKDPAELGLVEAIKTLDGALAKGSLPEATKLYKAINLNRDGFGGYGIDSTADDLLNMVGHEIKDNAFSSSSVSLLTASGFQRDNRILMEIEAEKGTKGMYVGNADARSANPREHEFILPRGAVYSVTGVRTREIEYGGKTLTLPMIVVKVTT